MIPTTTATEYQKCVMPWVYDRMEVTASLFLLTPENMFRDSFKRETERVSFCLLGTWHCEYQGGPNMQALAGYCGRVLKRPGFYGLTGKRYLP